MPRRMSPREYYDEDYELERERDRHNRSRRKDRRYTENLESLRRRSMPPVEELERLRIRERPARDLVRETRDRGHMVMRRSREKVNEVLPEYEQEDFYKRARPPGRSHRPPPLDEESILDEIDYHEERRPRDFEVGDVLGREVRTRVKKRREVEEDLSLDEQDIRERPRRPREFEEELDTDDKEVLPGRRYWPRERERSHGSKESLVVDGRRCRRKSRAYDSEGDYRPYRSEFETDEVSQRSSRHSRKPQLREYELDELEREDRMRRLKRQDDRLSKEELVLQWKDRPSAEELSERSSESELIDREYEIDETVRSQPSSSQRMFKGHKEIGHRGAQRRHSHHDPEMEEVMFHNQRRSSHRPIRAPPLPDEVTHHTPQVRVAAPSSSFSSSDDTDFQPLSHKDRRTNNDVIIEESIEEECLSPIRDTPEMEMESAALHNHHNPIHEPSIKIGEKTDTIEVQEEVSGSRSLVDEAFKDTDEWSMIHTPSKDDAIEMSGALQVVEVAPRGSLEKAEHRGRIPAKAKKPREHWTEITKSLAVREAIERLGYEFEETRMFYYIFSFLTPADIDEIVELSDQIRRSRRRRIKEIQLERALLPPVPISDQRPHRRRTVGDRRGRDREWTFDTRH